MSALCFYAQDLSCFSFFPFWRRSQILVSQCCQMLVILSLQLSKIDQIWSNLSERSSFKFSGLDLREGPFRTLKVRKRLMIKNSVHF